MVHLSDEGLLVGDHLGAGVQALQDELVRRLQPHVHGAHRAVGEGSDAQLLPVRAVDVQQADSVGGGGERARQPDVQVGTAVGEGGGEEGPRQHVHGQARDKGPGFPVPVHNFRFSFFVYYLKDKLPVVHICPT